MVDGTETVQCR